jgi:hypothetical protein
MNWKTMFGMMLALGSLTAAAARAQERPAPSDAPAVDAQIAKSHAAPHEAYAQDDLVVADGVPLEKPNPISDFLDRARQLGNAPVEEPLVDDFRTDGTGTDGHYK